MAYIGLDIGTSACKASIITKEGKNIATAHSKYSFKFPQKGYVELDPLEIYSKIKHVLKELAPKAETVRALSLSSFGEAFVLLDDCERPLYNFITYADDRCDGIDRMISKRYTAEKIFGITGLIPNQSYSLCKLLWFKEHKPEIIEKTKSIYLANDYYNYLLTGERGVDSGTASKTLLLDIHANDWSDEILNEFEIPREWFSPVKEVGSFLGKIKSDLAKELGLSSNIDVYLGCHDQCSATLGGGVLTPGSLMIGEGSTESINLVVDETVFKYSSKLIESKTCVEPFVEPGLFMLQASLLTYGNSIRWYIKTFEEEIKKQLEKGVDIFEHLEKNSKKETNLVFIPHLSKVNIMEPDVEIPGAFIGITLDTERWEFYRAIIQGLNFESKINLDNLQGIGVGIAHIRATGGITNSRLFTQFKADVLGQDIHILENSESGIMGLAIICAVASGDFHNYKDAIDKFVNIKKAYHPKHEYDELFDQYVDIRKRLRKKV